MTLDLIPDIPTSQLGIWGGLALDVAFVGLGVVAFTTWHKVIGAIVALMAVGAIVCLWHRRAPG
jgi:hypothetical protein